ncbi:Transposase [Cohaesibacter sp. ES.047]|uniref:IS110 family transposase n=1 Tax=Cohaesibacter sp. ES.047 TaxID=1798205 RepID=UPI000BB68214|nr:IS110 family transposase [Cohaesibacter sp. ES.047]SNY91124.1 Transposase [Cohaesibacter sp. ES.047]
MKQVFIIGIDLAKNTFQVHGATKAGNRIFNKKVTRAKLISFLTEIPNCIVAMEACASSHYWGRRIEALGHTIKLIPPAYVKPYVKRQKNDANDAEAIAEAASRPTMRFVAVKSVEKQASGMALRTRDLLIRQKTQTINALRGHLAEYGIIAPCGTVYLNRLQEAVNDPETELPDAVIANAQILLDHIASLAGQISQLEKDIREAARQDERARKLMSVPGIGPITAVALTALAPDPASFRKGRDFAAWTGLTPKQYSSGGKERIGHTSKMGQRDLRRLLIIGAASVVRWAIRRGSDQGGWLGQMLARKPRMLVTVALANKMARVAWALMSKNEKYKDPAMV